MRENMGRFRGLPFEKHHEALDLPVRQQWSYGSLIDHGQNGVYVEFFENNDEGPYFGDWVRVRVDPATVGQWTGLKDKNGVEIFEGDVVKDRHGKSVVYWCDLGVGRWWFYNKQDKHIRHFDLTTCKVIGNRWDNPELVK